jgi:hypothetical protein
MDFTIAVIGIVSGIVGGVIGGAVAIYTSIRSGRREEWKKIEEDNDFAFFKPFLQTQIDKGHRVGRIRIEVDTHSPEWRSAERLLERGFLERGPEGRGYLIRGFENVKAKPFEAQPEKRGREIVVDRGRHS